MNPSRIPTDYFHQAGLVKVGDEKALVPDMPTGIMSLYERVPAEKGLGYYTVSLTGRRTRATLHCALITLHIPTMRYVSRIYMHGVLGPNRIRSLATPSSFSMTSWLTHPNLFTSSTLSSIFPHSLPLLADVRQGGFTRDRSGCDR